jgi:hypothetical protein
MSFAEKSVDLYTMSTLVVNQSEQVRRQAAMNGMANVIVRLSGSRASLDSPEVSNAIKNASNYLYQFSYQSTDKTLTIAGASQPATRLIMRFSQAPLEKLLQDARLPVWSSNRPDVLVWTADNNKGQNYVSASSSIGQSLKSAAISRGLPIVSPVLDLEDRKALSVSRLWALDEGSIRVASTRYQADAVLAGRFSKRRQQWTGNFILLHQGKTHYFTASGERQSAIANSVIDQVTEYFASIYAVVPGSSDGSNAIVLQVNNISDFARYTQVLSYLEKLPLIDTFMLSNVDSEQLQVTVNLNTDLERFLTTLELDKKLRRLDSDEVTQVPDLSVSLSQNTASESSISENSVDILAPEVNTPAKKKAIQFVWRQ